MCLVVVLLWETPEFTDSRFSDLSTSEGNVGEAPEGSMAQIRKCSRSELTHTAARHSLFQIIWIYD